MNKTILHAFYWEMNEGGYAKKFKKEANLWQLLAERAAEIADAGFSSLWLPPANKGHAGTYDVGYGTYDLWDLGEFKQKGTVRTKYGTKRELETAIKALHDNNLNVLYDAVLNHRLGADEVETVTLASGERVKVWTKFNFAGRNNKYSSLKLDWHCFDGIDSNERSERAGKYLFENKEWDNAYDDDYLMGADIDYNYQKIREDVIDWGKWISNQIGFDGFRLDASKHIDNNFIDEWISEVQASSDKNLMFIGEAWIENKDRLADYLDTVNNPDLKIFDFPLRSAFTELASGNLDLRWFGSRGLVNKPGYEEQAVTFVDNHDTDRDRDNEYGTPPIFSRKYQAYTYILTREHGLPVVFWKDYYVRGMKEGIDKLLKVRNKYAYGAGFECNSNDQQTYSYVREGTEEYPESGLVMMITQSDEGGIIKKRINSLQPEATFYDYTGNVREKVTTDSDGFGDFMVRADEAEGWSVWVRDFS